MTAYASTNIVTGRATRSPKTLASGSMAVIYTIPLTTALANGDTISGPVLPAGYYLDQVKVDTDQLDSGGTPLISFTVGYAGTPAAFISSAPTARTGGIVSANVAGTTGFATNPATGGTDTTILVTITAGAATPKAGTMRIQISYTRDA